MQIELVERARTGDHDAFSLLVRASGSRLYGIAKLILRDPDRAQDAVQDAFALAWRDVRALRDPGAWDAWLYRLTVNACYRSAKRNRRQEMAEVHLVTDEEHATATDFSAHVVERDRLGRELGRLPVDQRAVMVLHFYLDLPLTDVADILDIPTGTAKSRLHRGLATLRSALAVRAPRAPSDRGEVRMSQQMSLERMVADWMVDETAGGLPEHVFDQIVTTTSRRRPLPRWLAVLREPEMRAQSQVAVGVPRRPLILIGVALLLAAAVAIGVGAATLLRPQASTDVWPGFRGDASRAGLGVTGPVGNPVIRWTFPATGSVSSNIAVAGDLVLAPSDDGLLHALGIEDGRERWSFAGAAPMKGPLAIGDRAWVADGAGVVHAMTLPDGKSLWDSTSPYAAPSDLTVMDDRLYLGTRDGAVVAMDAASGREVWRQTIGTSPIHAPAVANGTIVIASDAGDAKALDPATGAVRWTAHASDAGIGTPVIAGDLVFVGAGADSTGSRLVAFDLASGAERWHDDRFLAAPAIAGDIAYTTGPDGLVSAIDRATGAVRWTGSLERQPPRTGRRRRRPSTSARIVCTRSSRWTSQRGASCGASTSTGRTRAASGWRGASCSSAPRPAPSTRSAETERR